MKKLLLGLMLLVCLSGFSQTKILGVYNTGNSTGAEAIFSFKPLEERVYSLGAGITGGNNFKTEYGILTQDVTKNFSIGGKVGGWNPCGHGQNNTYLYYGTVAYLQFTGKDKGWVLGTEYDNLKHFSFGLGYKF